MYISNDYLLNILNLFSNIYKYIFINFFIFILVAIFYLTF
jgi:hypothetical protein